MFTVHLFLFSISLSLYLFLCVYVCVAAGSVCLFSQREMCLPSRIAYVQWKLFNTVSNWQHPTWAHLEIKINWAMVIKGIWHDEVGEPLEEQLQQLPCAPALMEKELARISKNYPFSITQADSWLQEGLWFDSREGERKNDLYWTKGLLTDWPQTAENLAYS